MKESTYHCYLGIVLLALTACGLREPEWRTYEETTRDASSSAPAPRGKAAALTWTAPHGWTELPASGMRLAAFSIQRDGATGTCTIITLGGAAGGTEANVRRWIGQLSLKEPPAEELAAFIERQERMTSEGGFTGVIVDLTELGTQPADASSMLASLLAVRDSTIFLKVTGPVSLLRAEKESFAALCKSVRNSE